MNSTDEAATPIPSVPNRKARDIPEVLAEPPEDRLWTVQEVARYLVMSKDYVYRRVAERVLRAVKFGNKTRFDPADVRAFAALKKTGG